MGFGGASKGRTSPKGAARGPPPPEEWGPPPSRDRGKGRSWEDDRERGWESPSRSDQSSWRPAPGRRPAVGPRREEKGQDHASWRDAPSRGPPRGKGDEHGDDSEEAGLTPWDLIAFASLMAKWYGPPPGYGPPSHGSGKSRKGGGKEGGKDAPSRPSNNIIFVGGLPETVSEDIIRDSFEMFGEVVDVKIMFDDRGDSKGYCFVTFANVEDAKEVLSNYDHNTVDGKWVDCKPSSGSSGGVKPGDWTCPQCGDNVFARRDACNRCGYSSSRGARTAKGASAKGKRPGDWICPSCSDLVFSSRDKCNTCGEPKPASARRVSARPGDWSCPGCGDLVFASKNVCSLCHTPKPDNGDDYGSTQTGGYGAFQRYCSLCRARPSPY